MARLPSARLSGTRRAAVGPDQREAGMAGSMR